MKTTITHSLSKKYILFSLIVMCSSTQVMSQASFKRAIGQTDFYNRGNAIKQTNDDGYIVAGRTVSFDGGGVQAYLVKTDAEGNTQWAKNYGESGSEEAESITLASDGGFVFTGYSNSAGSGKRDVYLVRADMNGDTVWTKVFGGMGIDGGRSVDATEDNGFIIAGETYSYGKGTVNAYLIKTNGQGDTAWTKVFGGNGIEQGNSVRQTKDGGYIITGRTNSFGAGDYDVYLIRTDEKGNKLWMQTFGGSGSEEGNSVKETEDGGYIITGYTKSYGQGGADVFIVRTDKSGNQIWTQSFGGATDDYGRDVEQTNDGGFIIAGYTNSFNNGMEAYLIRTDKEGNSIWEYTYGESSDDFGNSVCITNDGGFVIGGSTIRSLDGPAAEKIKNVYLIKTDPSGK